MTYPHLKYPVVNALTDFTGFFPVDFMLEAVLDDGFNWFKTNPDAPDLVFSHLKRNSLKSRYGQNKVNEIAQYVRENEIRIIQSFPKDSEQSPIISINMANSGEAVEKAGFDDFAGEIDTIDGAGSVVSRKELGYLPMRDELLISVHATGTPDKVKYLYYITMYILGAFKNQLEGQEGDNSKGRLFNITFRVTDLSRLNEYLPSDMFSRFITLTLESSAHIEKGKVPILKSLELDVDFE